ncbi:MAG: hypothetical protein ACLQVI_34940 [Polyangiaceae bacterium]
MTSTKILATSLLAILAAACTTQPSGGSSGSTTVPTAGAATVHGDLTPVALLKAPLPKPTETALLHGADPLSPVQAFVLETPALPTVGRDFWRTFTGADPASLTFPVDNPQGARVIVSTLDHTPLRSLHMHSVETGLRLDHSRDSTNTAGVNRGHTQLREPAFESLLDSRQLSFDEPFTRGLVQLDIPADLAAHGIHFEVQEPNSRITLAAVPGELVYTHGQTGELAFALDDGGGAVDGGTITAIAEYPNHTRSAAFSVTPLGNGKYTAKFPLAGTDNQGVWSIHVQGTGVSNGVPFERSVDTAFEYTPAHAHMTGIGQPQILRGSDGLIDEISVDVAVETLNDDRFSVRGTLTYNGADGAEHPLAQAQTGQALNAGTGTITLHFTSDAIALAQVSGPFHLRDVALVSDAFGFTQHRIGRALDLTTGAIAASEIRYPAQISLGARELMANGELPQRK